ncbi:hypothetical protein LQ939_13595 [Pantoea alhagi]|uniref:hypothetical protein n=1 Tax=Pantoea alhagi TaxID=1891675 RepID=UPI00202B58B2|nr:hypothetical protein [Pantoea alhagi]URQ59793.1 hypothetical protein LQ939_13595 [Pantoea alhagi]
MSLSLPGTDLYYLPRDDLAPEKYEEIISPYSAWWHTDSKYVFDDRPTLGFQLINMHQRDVNGYTNQLPPYGPREREKLRRMLFSGEVVMLGGSSVTKGELFYIDEHGELICRSPLAFKFDGARDIIREYKRSVARRDYSRKGGKPRPTVLPARQAKVTQSAQLNIINSKAAGRLLAAGGMYNGNPEGFRQTAEQLGGDALAGYQQMMSAEVKGLLITGASVAAGLTMGRLHVRVSNNAVDASALHQKSIKKIGELATQFNSALVHPKKFKLNINGRIIVADAESSLGAPVFKGVTDIEVLNYFRQLAGLEKLPPAKIISGKGVVYSVKLNDESAMTLRDFSTSAHRTGAKWTIDLITPSINGGRKVEVKFK